MPQRRVPPPQGDYPNSRGRTWAVAPHGKAHLTADGRFTNCGKRIEDMVTTGWGMRRRDHYLPADDGIRVKACGSCI